MRLDGLGEIKRRSGVEPAARSVCAYRDRDSAARTEQVTFNNMIRERAWMQRARERTRHAAWLPRHDFPARQRR